MDILQVVLVILVSVWTLIFIIITALVFVIFVGVRRIVRKISNIVDETEDVARKVDIPSKIVMASILGFMAKNSAEQIKSFIKDSFFKAKGKKR